MEYFDEIENKVEKQYEIADKARSRGLDPKTDVEISLAEDMAERVENLVGPPGIAEEIRRLEEKHDREEVAFKIAEQIVDGEFYKGSDEDLVEQAIQTALSILTEGVAVAAPTEGISSVKIDGHLKINYSGPIRAAGGTGAALSVLIADFIRRKVGVGGFDASKKLIDRFKEEVKMYDEVSGLQYLPSDREIGAAIHSLPVEIAGDGTENQTVKANKNTPGIETDRIRGGAMLVVAEGILQKVPKLIKHVERLGIDGWEWLNMLKGESEEKGEESNNEPEYLKDVIAGRPVIGHPGSKGGLRLRYGRARNTGLAAGGIHPAAMRIMNDQFATGTQIKTEKPGKATITNPVDSIEPPVVKLEGGDVIRVESGEKAKKIRDEIEEVISVGDLLLGVGEFIENNKDLLPSGYCEEWWAGEVKRATDEVEDKFVNPPYEVPSPKKAVEISMEHDVPLHPRYTFPYHDVSVDRLKGIDEWLMFSEMDNRVFWNGNNIDKIVLPMDKKKKRTLEVLEIPHEKEGSIIMIDECAYPLWVTFMGTRDSDQEENIDRSGPMEYINSMAPFEVRKKAPTRIGARMGRPEKAKERRMNPPANVLYPIGNYGGNTRDIKKAVNKHGEVELEVQTYKCDECDVDGTTTRICPECGKKASVESSESSKIDIRDRLHRAENSLGKIGTEGTIKGVRGLVNEDNVAEPLEKGILRAERDLWIYKDGTIRYDLTEAPLTHFKPKEIGVSPERLRELGYEEDINGDRLEEEGQVVEMKPQDLLLPVEAAEYFLRTSKYVDDMLEGMYGMDPYYEAESVNDLVGEIMIAIAPHISAGTVGRVIGFSEAKVGYAHPYIHAGVRRNCDSDEVAVMLLLQALVDFSKKYLPKGHGGAMDAPLVITHPLDPEEIDDEVHNMDISSEYPVELYRGSLMEEDPKGFSEMVEDRLGEESQYNSLSFTHDTSDISAGPSLSGYKTLEGMDTKTMMQMELAEKLMSVDEVDVAERVLRNHFIRDIKGNIRACTSQKFRCTRCGTKYRRPPIKSDGKCKCSNDLILTVPRGGVEKYVNIAKKVCSEYEVSDYLSQQVNLLSREIDDLFENEESDQMEITEFVD